MNLQLFSSQKIQTFPGLDSGDVLAILPSRLLAALHGPSYRRLGLEEPMKGTYCAPKRDGMGAWLCFFLKMWLIFVAPKFILDDFWLYWCSDNWPTQNIQKRMILRRFCGATFSDEGDQELGFDLVATQLWGNTTYFGKWLTQVKGQNCQLHLKLQTFLLMYIPVLDYNYNR